MYYYRHYIPVVGIIWAIVELTRPNIPDAAIVDSDMHFNGSVVIQSVSFLILILCHEYHPM